MMHRIQLAFFFLIFGLTIILGFLVLRPYINILILAGTFAVIFFPLYERILHGFGNRWPGFASLLTIIAILVIVFLPLGFLGSRIVTEAQDFLVRLQEAKQNETSILGDIPDSSNPTIAHFQEQVRAFLTENTLETQQYVQAGVNWITAHIGPFFQSIAGVLLASFLWIFSLFYFFRDWKKIRFVAIAASPLDDQYDQEILGRMQRAIKSVIGGTLVVAILQGVLAGIGFAIFGVPTPFIWGSLAILAALIPTIGTALVTGPAVIFLFLIGKTLPALGLFIWAVAIVGMLDNILRPILIDRGIHLHPLLILLSVLGGIALFGPIGFLNGPLIMALLSEFSKIYRQLVLHEKQTA